MMNGILLDAYVIVDKNSRVNGGWRFRVEVNLGICLQHSREFYTKIAKVTDRFLDLALDYMGYLPEDG